MSKFKPLWMLGILFIALNISCKSEDPGPSNTKGSRIFSIDVNETSSVDYGTALSIAQDLGIDEVKISLDWKSIETSPLNYNDDLIELINDYYSAQGMAITLIIRPINGPNLVMPNDIAGFPFDSQNVITRMLNLLDFLHANLPDVAIRSIHVGNEVDMFLSENPIKWNEYEDFFVFTRDKIKSLWGSNMPVGVVMTYRGLVDDDLVDFSKSLNTHANVVALTYYPLNNDITFRDPSTVPADISKLLGIYTQKTIYFQEAGFATSTICNGSEEKQAQFVQQMFAIWDAHASQIQKIDFTWLHDQPDHLVDDWVDEYHMDGNPNESKFRAYLKSLGYRTEGGSDKQAFVQMKNEASTRGW